MTTPEDREVSWYEYVTTRRNRVSNKMMEVSDILDITRRKARALAERDEMKRKEIVKDLVMDLAKIKGYPKNKIKKRVTQELVGKRDPKTGTKTRITHRIIEEVFSAKEFADFK